MIIFGIFAAFLTVGVGAAGLMVMSEIQPSRYHAWVYGLIFSTGVLLVVIVSLKIMEIM